MNTQLVSSWFHSPVGQLTLVASDAGLRAILWPTERPGRVKLPDISRGDHAIFAATATQLTEYFAGKRQTFDIPLDLHGTPFQVKAWRSLADIRFGTTASYTEQATRLGAPNAARAVGAANGRNPVSIVLPCHRVIASNGSLTGFAGGLHAKRWLLEFESRYLLEEQREGGRAEDRGEQQDNNEGGGRAHRSTA
jgi:methylated-DNA-[protein]-cysteine S-methyltransferase